MSPDPNFWDFLDGELLKVPELNHRRAPGSTCMSALIAGKMGTPASQVNASKGCGGVMRVAPIGLFCRALPDAGDDLRIGMWPSSLVALWPPSRMDIPLATCLPVSWRR